MTIKENNNTNPKINIIDNNDKTNDDFFFKINKQRNHCYFFFAL